MESFPIQDQTTTRSDLWTSLDNCVMWNVFFEYRWPAVSPSVMFPNKQFETRKKEITQAVGALVVLWLQKTNMTKSSQISILSWSYSFAPLAGTEKVVVAYIRDAHDSFKPSWMEILSADKFGPKQA